MAHQHHPHHHGETPEFSGLRGRFFAWMLTGPLRKILEWRMGNPDPRLLELLDLDGSETVVDSGCGSGHHALMVAERLPQGHVIGVDVSQEMLDQFAKNAKRRRLADRAEGVLGDALALPLDDASADRAISVAAFHHLDDPLKACTEMVRVLRKGGRAVVIDLHIGPGGIEHMGGHDRPFDAAEMERILTETGLEEIRVERVKRWLIGTGVKPA